MVLYTGLLDQILSSGPVQEPPNPQTSSNGVGGLFSGLFSSPKNLIAKSTTQPTEQQTLQLASVLAHEMGHLILSHHLETLSQQQVLWPSVLGLGLDLTRAFIWPIT